MKKKKFFYNLAQSMSNLLLQGKIIPYSHVCVNWLEQQGDDTILSFIETHQNTCRYLW